MRSKLSSCLFWLIILAVKTFPIQGDSSTGPSFRARKCVGLLREDLEDCVFCDLAREKKSIDFIHVNTENFYDYSIYETKHFTLKISKGPYNEGHFLIVSKQHYDRYADLPVDALQDFKNLQRLVENYFSSEYGSFISFEHGSVYANGNSTCSLNSAGSCIDHLHVHFIPTRIDLESYMSRFGRRFKKIDSIERLRALSGKDREAVLGFRNYIYYKSPNGIESVLDVGPSFIDYSEHPEIEPNDLDQVIQLPSQFIRLALALEENQMSKANWRFNENIPEGLEAVYRSVNLNRSEILKGSGILDPQAHQSIMANNNTMLFYNKNAVAYAESHQNYNLRRIYDKFLALLPKRARILDIGSGSGRDSSYFLKMGFRVEGLEGSSKMAKIGQEFSRTPVRTQKVQNFNKNNNESEKYDAVWAFATLLHLNDKDLLNTLFNLKRAVREGGHLFLSFREGESIGFDDRGRFFNHMNEKRFRDILTLVTGLKIISIEVHKDSRSSKSYKWLEITLQID